MDPFVRLSCAYVLDWLIGDPEKLPHPVRVVGHLAHTGERLLRRGKAARGREFVSGAILSAGVVGASALAPWLLVRCIHARHRVAAAVIDIWLAASCLATRNLVDEAAAVLHKLEGEDLVGARQRLARIVGRDTATLDESEVCRALIETLAESLSDGIVAPLFYLALGGVPMAMAYKAINTLDSMIGHRDERYLYFGRAAARLDDAANWIPARISALLLTAAAAASAKEDGLRALCTWLSDGSHHASPNAGQPESAMAGALAVRLGGENRYGGERIVSQFMGARYRKPDRRAAHRALHLVAASSLLGFAAALLITGARRNVR